MKGELAKLEDFKIATVLQILLSRYAHHKETVREIIIHLLANLACHYPNQSVWWIYHFLHFETEGAQVQQQRRPGQKSLPAISRKDFANALLNRIKFLNGEAHQKILKCEKVFHELKKLAEKQPADSTKQTMDMPSFLSKLTDTEMVMPIEENLSP